MSATAPSRIARRFQSLKLSRLSVQGRIMGAGWVVLLGVLALTGQQALQIARHDASAALKIQASAQLAALSQVVTDAAVAHDYSAVKAHLKRPVEAGNLLLAEYTAPNGHTLSESAPAHSAGHPGWFDLLTGLHIPVLQQTLTVDGTGYGNLLIKPSAQAYEAFLWHLGTRLFLVLVAAFTLFGWLTHVLLKFSLKDLYRLRATARRIEAGDYSARIPIRADSPPELRETTRAFNLMSVALEQLLTDLNEQQKALDSTACVTESDLAGNITTSNELFCIVSGYTSEELIGENHRILNSGWHDTAFFNQLWETITNGRSWRGELCNRAKDGRLFWTATTIIPIKGDDGLPLKYLSIRFDITQRKIDQAAISAEKERWQVTLQSINDAVIVTNALNQISYLNPAAENLLGIPLTEAQSHPLNHLMQLDQVGDNKEAPACFISAPVVPHGQTGSAQLHTRLGHDLAISYSCAPLPGNGGMGAVYVLRDETEKKQLLDNLRDMAFHDTLTRRRIGAQ